MVATRTQILRSLNSNLTEMSGKAEGGRVVREDGIEPPTDWV